MPLLGQRETKQHILDMKWRNARIIHLCIIDYPLRRFGISHTIFITNHYIPLVLLGLSRGLGCRKGCLGWHLFRPSSRGEISHLYLLYSTILFLFVKNKKKQKKVDTTQACLLITEPYFNLPNIQEVYDQLVFEEYEFSSYHRCTRK